MPSSINPIALILWATITLLTTAVDARKLPTPIPALTMHSSDLSGIITAEWKPLWTALFPTTTATLSQVPSARITARQETPGGLTAAEWAAEAERLGGRWPFIPDLRFCRKYSISPGSMPPCREYQIAYAKGVKDGLYPPRNGLDEEWLRKACEENERPLTGYCEGMD